MQDQSSCLMFLETADFDGDGVSYFLESLNLSDMSERDEHSFSSYVQISHLNSRLNAYFTCQKTRLRVLKQR